MVATLVLSAVLVAACGDSNDEPEPTSTTASAAVATTAPEATATIAPTATASVAPTSTPRSTATATVAPSPTTAAAPESDVELAVEPDTGTFGDEFDLMVSGLTPDQHYVLVIREPNGVEWWDDVWANATGDGLLVQDERYVGKMPMSGFWYSAEGEPLGEYVVELRADDRNTILATASFTITEAASAPEEMTLTIDPPSGLENTKFMYEFTGLTASEEYQYVVQLPDGSEYRASVTADSDGSRLIAADSGPDHAVGDTLDRWLAATGAPTGDYVVQLRTADGETVLAESRFVVLKPVVDSGIELSVNPERGSRGGLPFIILMTGDIDPDAIYVQAVLYPDGTEETFEVQYDPTAMEMVIVSGPFKDYPASFWEVAPGDPLGEYIVEIRDLDTNDVLARDTFVVE